MRLRRLPSFLSSLTLLPTLAAPALAVPTISLQWSGTTGSGSTGGSSITVSNTAVETLTLDLVVQVGSEELVGLFASLQFDVDLGNELDLISFQEIGWSNPMATRKLEPFKRGLLSTQESTDQQAGKLYMFEVTTTGRGATNLSFVFARVVFRTVPGNVASDGDDVSSGFFAPDGSGSSDGAYELPEGAERSVPISQSLSFGAASVNAP
jgi:hypothetical protein